MNESKDGIPEDMTFSPYLTDGNVPGILLEALVVIPDPLEIIMGLGADILKCFT
jgi:hypothetical protein